jgi:hypothetical protein
MGNGAVFLASIKKGSRTFGKTEVISLFLFMMSCIIWLLFNAPLLNLAISLVAHFVGGVPTIARTLKDPDSEKAIHWYFFFIASIFTIIASPDKTFESILFPVYFGLFDGLIILLVNRKRLLNII